MFSPKQAAQPNPSYPALCRQDTTSPWSTDYGGNILNSDTNASNKKYLKEIEEKLKKKLFSSEKMNKENEKHKKSKNEEMNKK